MAAKIEEGRSGHLMLAGKLTRASRARCCRCRPSDTRATVQGLNLHRRHTKQTASTDAGIFTRETPIHLSNLALIDAPRASRRASGSRSKATAKKLRVAKSTGDVIDG